MNLYCNQLGIVAYVGILFETFLIITLRMTRFNDWYAFKERRA